MQSQTACVLSVQFLGQSGCRLGCGETVIYVDPYLSNSVQELDAPDLERLIPVPVPPEQIRDADWVLVTHAHMDHCDPHTLPKIANASPRCEFLGPAPVLEKLEQWGIASTRLHLAKERWESIAPHWKVYVVPAAHPMTERDGNGNLRSIGYLLEIEGKRLYHAGDTCVTQELINVLGTLCPISTAILPVNEQNFFRSRRDIIGNMSVREAFLLAEEVGIDNVIPVHWDMFALNAASLEEIHAIYRQMKPAFTLQVQPVVIAL